MTFPCASCNEEVSDGPTCSSCQKSYDFSCSGISEVGYRRLGERKSAWRCPSCKLGGGGDASPINPGGTPSAFDFDLVMRRLDTLSNQLKPLSTLVADVHGIKEDIKEIKQSAATTSSRIDEVETRITQVEKSHEDVNDLKIKISELEEDLQAKEQWLRANNVEIKGIPQTQNENLFDILKKLGDKIAYPVPKSLVNFITRVPTRDAGQQKSKPIIISFVNRYAKENFVAAGRQFKELRASDVGMSGSERIYINDHLTGRNKELLSKTKKLAKSKNFDFIWVSHGKILVRRNVNSHIIHVKSEKDLSKIN
ncbi:hypothetical protein NE865_04884 [Phthorimaea operculella]|nr:hypothetical protein NE865_04884 [Phthorimaea operculella]